MNLFPASTNQQEKQDITRRLLILGGLAMALLFAFMLFRYISMPLITVKTNDPANYINIDEALGAKGTGNLPPKQAQGKLSLRLSPGRYQVTVYDKNQYGTSRVVDLKSWQHLSLSLNPVAATDPEPVYGRPARSIVSDGSQLLFLGLQTPSGGQVLRTDASGNLTNLFPDSVFTFVAWASAGLGLAQNRDGSDYTMYLIKDGQLSALELPEGVAADAKLSADLAKDGTVYVSDGRNVYTGKIGGNYKKIYTGNNEIFDLLAGRGRVAVVSDKNKRDAGAQAEQDVVVVSDTGEATRHITGASSVRWSPGGKYLLGAGDVFDTIYTPSLNLVKTITVNGSANFAWLADNSLLYSVDSQLWRYDLPTGLSVKIAARPAKINITAIYPDESSSYVYITDDNTEKQQIFRVGLKGQKFDTTLTALSIFTPEVLDDCALNYINFIKTTVTMEYPSTDSGQHCIDLARNEIQTYGMDETKLQLQLLPY